MAETIYNSSFTGEQIDEAVSDVRQNKANWNNAATHSEDGTVHVTEEEKTAWNNKVSQEKGKGLSSNDYTDEEKDAVATIEDLTADVKTLKEEGASSTKVVEGITVLSTGWVDETETTALWRYRISDANIVADTIVNVHFSVTDGTEDVASSLVRATNAGLLAATTASVGYVDIYSTGQPDSDLTCSLELTDFKVV